MEWQESWRSIFGGEPPIPGSREESVQDVLSRLIAGRTCDWFTPYTPTPEGRAFLSSLWGQAFEGPIGQPEWFVSEYSMTVPVEWRADIAYTYRCVDLAWGDGERIIIVELKTERGSYRADQIPDYLRLVRHRNPGVATDVVLLGPYRPGYAPARDDRQRYVELIWDDLRPLLVRAFPTDDLADKLAYFLQMELSATFAADLRSSRITTPDEGSPEATTVTREDEIDTAVAHALRMAPSVALANKGDATERGIDVSFGSEADARSAIQEIKSTLSNEGWDDRVSVWLWRSVSTDGQALTQAGKTTGLELRLAPQLTHSST